MTTPPLPQQTGVWIVRRAPDGTLHQQAASFTAAEHGHEGWHWCPHEQAIVYHLSDDYEGRVVRTAPYESEGGNGA